ncbi:MAG TPA: DNA alkylation repair protein [Rhodothermales bacterium]|nr:DNA alkylation repair protein [Rhodothermales bacterium]
MTAEQFINKLKTYQSAKEQQKIQRYLKTDASDHQVLGVRMKQVFDLAKEHTDMSLEEIEALLESLYYEARMGAMSIMDFQAQYKKTTEAQRKNLFDLYIDRHDRINNWDLVDRAAKRVIGGYLYDFKKPRDILYKLARSENIWERRTAMASTSYFIRKGDLDDTYNIAEILLQDEHDLIHKAVGGWLREAGKQDLQRLLRFLDQHAATMPRTMLRYATEKLDKQQRDQYRSLKQIE